MTEEQNTQPEQDITETETTEVNEVDAPSAETAEQINVEDASAEPLEAEGEEKLECTVSVDDCGPWKKKISVDISREQIDKELDKQYGELRYTAQIPGFRKGRAPRRLIEKRYGEDIGDQTKLRLLAQAFEQIEEGQEFEVLGEPDFDPEKIELPKEGDFHFEYEVEVKPEFELPNLEGVRIEKPLFEVTEERVEEALDQLLKRQGRIEDITDAGTEETDVITAEVTMKAEGVEEPVQEETRLFVRAKNLLQVPIEEDENWLVGVKIGDTKTCSATVPEDFGREDFRGKEAEFEIRVKGIRRLIPAELNEEFFGQLGVSDEQELKKHLEENLEQQADREVRNQMSQQVYRFLDEAIGFELPVGVATRNADRALQQQYFRLLQQGVPQEQITQNLDQLRASSTAESQRQLKMSFILAKASEELGIEVSDGEVNAVVAQAAAQSGRRPERMREEMQREGRLEQVKDQLRDEKAVDRILEMAEVVDAPIKEEPAAEEKPKKRTARKKKTTKKSGAKKDESSEAKSEETTDKKTKKKTAKKSVKRKPPSSDE
jgi:trigger factor